MSSIFNCLFHTRYISLVIRGKYDFSKMQLLDKNLKWKITCWSLLNNYRVNFLVMWFRHNFNSWIKMLIARLRDHLWPIDAKQHFRFHKSPLFRFFSFFGNPLSCVCFKMYLECNRNLANLIWFTNLTFEHFWVSFGTKNQLRAVSKN